MFLYFSEIIFFKLKQTLLYAKFTMQKINYVLFFTLKNAKKKYYASTMHYLSELDTYGLYKKHELKLTSKQNLKTSKKSRLGPQLGCRQ